MFLNDYIEIDKDDSISKLARVSSTFNGFYDYWRDNLFERIMRLFVWSGTYNEETGEGVKPKEIEQRLLLQGHCGITKIKKEKELTAMFGNYFGVAKYLDEKPYYMVRCPIYSGKRTIGKDIVVIDSNSLRNPAYDLVHHYAIMLAHLEVTLVDLAVNARDAGGIPVAKTEKQKRSIIDYMGKLFNGQYGVISDVGMLGVEYAGADRKTSQDIMNILECRERYLKSFYSDIGVRSAFEKRSNTVESEVEADTSLLLLNLADMIKCREEGAKAVNKMFGTNWSVKIAEEIDYGSENQRTKFDTVNTVHEIERGDNNENSK